MEVGAWMGVSFENGTDEQILNQTDIKTLLTASSDLLALIGHESLEDSGLSLVSAYNKAKSRLSSSEVASRLNLSDAELPPFEASLRDFAKRFDAIESDDPERTTVISALRLVSWFETLQSRGVAITIPDFSGLPVDEDVGRKQIRALELILRSLVSERFGGDLEQQLKTIIKPELVDKWKASGDPDDLLSGTTFSELASLVVNKDEFSHYEKLYSHSAYLNYLRDRRKTVQNFLDDVRRVRNVLAHNKSISDAQLQLLELYYEELTSPIQDAFDNGETSVDPSAYLDVSREELQSYFIDLKEDIASVQDELADFRASVEGDLGVIKEDTAVIREATAGVKSRTTMVVAGVVALLVLVGGSYFFLVGTQENTEAILVDTATIKQTTTETNQAITEVQQSSRRIEGSLDSIKEGFENLSQQGGLIANPSNPAEYYHNSRIYRQRGEVDLALDSLRALMDYEFREADPIQDLVALLRQKYGNTGVNEAISTFIPDDRRVLLAYANLLVSQPLSKDLEFWLSTKPLFLPAVPEIVRYAADQGQNLSRYKLTTRLEKRFMETSQNLKEYYLDPVLATSAYNKVKRSYEKTNWTYYNNVKASPVYFMSGYMPNLIKRDQYSPLQRYIEFIPVLEDDTADDSPFMMRFRSTGDYAGNLFLQGVDDLSSWISFGECEGCASSIYGSFTMMYSDPSFFKDEAPTFPAFDPAIDRQYSRFGYPLICSSWVNSGNIYFDVKWVDSEGVERESSNIKLCPELIEPNEKLFVKNLGNTVDMREKSGWTRSKLRQAVIERFNELLTVRTSEEALSQTASEFDMFESELLELMDLNLDGDIIKVVNLSVDRILGLTWHPLQKRVFVKEVRLVDLNSGNISRLIKGETWQVASRLGMTCRFSCERMSNHIGNIWRIKTPFERFRLELETITYGLPLTDDDEYTMLSQDTYFANEVDIKSRHKTF